MKRKIKLALSLFVVFALFLVGCSTGVTTTTTGGSTTNATTSAATTGESTTTAATTTESTTAASGNNRFTLYFPEMTTPINLDGIVTQELMQKTGIIWDAVEVGSGADVAQQLNLKLAGGDIADALTLSGNSVLWARLINEKWVIPLDKYFDDPTNYPNLAKIDKRTIDFWRAADGHIYFVPTGYEPVLDQPSAWQGNAQGLWVRNDLLQKAGVSLDDIRTLEGFEAYLRKLKGMTDDSGREIIPLSLGGENFAGLEVVMSIFGVVGNSTGGWNEQPDGTVVQDYQLPGFKQAWQWLNKLYRDGLLDMETTTQKRDLYLEKVNSLRYGTFLFGGWDNPSATILKNYSIPDQTTYAELEAQGFPPEWYFPTYLPKIEGVEFAQYASFNPFGANGTGITSNCENPDTLMKALDWMQTQEAYLLMEYGPESLGNYKLVDGVAEQDNAVFLSDKYWGGTNPMANVTEVGFWWWKNVASVALTHVPFLEPPWIAGNAELYKAEQLNQEQGTYGLISRANRIRPVIGGSIEKNTPVQNDIRLNYYARMMMAESDSAFETAYSSFIDEMSVRGFDSETNAEFNELYKAYVATPAGQIEVVITKYMPRNVFSTKPEIVGR